MRKTSKVNARLQDKTAAQLREIARAEERSISDVIMRSIEAYYEKFYAEKKQQWIMLEKSGFIGCGMAEKNLSTSYKKSLSKSFSEKT